MSERLMPEIRSNSSATMKKMAAMSIYGKALKSSSPEPGKL